MRSFKRAIYKVGLSEELPQISCNDSLNVDGEKGIYEVDITIGTEIGDTGLRYEAFNIPDRFQLFFDGQLVADSKFVGDNLSIYKDELLDMTNKSLPVFEFDGFNFVNSGRTEIINPSLSDIANGTSTEPTEGKGQLKFNKDKAEVTTMKLRVIGALGSTLWNASPICPNSFNTDSGSVIPPSVKGYTLILHDNIRSSACYELEKGIATRCYSSGNLEIGTKLYLNTQLTNLITANYAYLGKTIYELNQGKITDIYPCHDMEAPI